VSGGGRHGLDRIVAADEDEARRIGPVLARERGNEDCPADSLPDAAAHVGDEAGVAVVEPSPAAMDGDATPHQITIEKHRPQLVSVSP
jgi:hypothetical protein